MNRITAGFAVIGAALAATSSAAERRPFTVADSISMTRIVDPDVPFGSFVTPVFKFSPDGKRFFLVTRRGNLSTGLNEFALVLFDSVEVARFVRYSRGKQLPAQDVLARFDTGSSDGGIAGARWLPDGSVALIGRGKDRRGQVYVMDLHTRQLRQLSHHAHDVIAYDFSPATGMLLYAGRVIPDWTERNQRGYPVGTDMIRDLVLRDPADAFARYGLFAADANSGEVRQVDVPPSFRLRDGDLQLSPTGRWAIAVTYPSDAPQSWWTDYEPLRSVLESAQAPDGIDKNLDIFRRDTDSLRQFVLVDMRTGKAAPAVDAPAGIGLTSMVAKALWSRDGSRVVLADTFLPLDVDDATERQRRRNGAAIIELDVAHRTFRRISESVGPREDPSAIGYLSAAEGSADASIKLTWQSSADQDTTMAFSRGAGGWTLAAPNTARSSSRLVLSIKQDLNSPPEVVAMLASGERTQAITDCNPQLRELELGVAREFRWKTSDGRSWLAGLVLPLGHREAIRYPLVVQTYGFDPGEFLVDGPLGIASAFAARALANRGIAVIQMPEDRMGYGGPDEGPNQLKLMRSAIDALADAGLVDSARVGVIGFSRTGMHVQHAITFTGDDFGFAAATISDSVSNGYWAYIHHYGTSYPGMLWTEWQVGAPFWDAGRALWLERSPAFNLHRVRTPLRIERFGNFLSDYWDTFAILKRHRRPVELIHVPDAMHRLDMSQPWARYASQEGNVDWFDFWLNGHEDPDPSKAQQYVRWRKLKADQEAQPQPPHASE